MSLSARTPAELLDLAKQAQGLDTDYMLSKVFAIPQGTVSRMRHNKHSPSDYYILFLCDLAGLDAAETLAAIRLHEAKSCGDDVAYKLWSKFALAS